MSQNALHADDVLAGLLVRPLSRRVPEIVKSIMLADHAIHVLRPTPAEVAIIQTPACSRMKEPGCFQGRGVHLLALQARPGFVIERNRSVASPFDCPYANRLLA